MENVVELDPPDDEQISVDSCKHSRMRIKREVEDHHQVIENENQSISSTSEESENEVQTASRKANLLNVSFGPKQAAMRQIEAVMDRQQDDELVDKQMAIDSDNGKDFLQCSKCGAGFPFLNALREHNAKCEPKQEAMRQIGAVMDRRQMVVEKVMDRKKPIGSNNDNHGWKCSKCGVGFPFPSALREHNAKCRYGKVALGNSTRSNRAEAYSKKRKYECHKCGFIYYRRPSFQQHLARCDPLALDATPTYLGNTDNLMPVVQETDSDANSMNNQVQGQKNNDVSQFFAHIEQAQAKNASNGVTTHETNNNHLQSNVKMQESNPIVVDRSMLKTAAPAPKEKARKIILKVNIDSEKLYTIYKVPLTVTSKSSQLIQNQCDNPEIVLSKEKDLSKASMTEHQVSVPQIKTNSVNPSNEKSSRKIFREKRKTRRLQKTATSDGEPLSKEIKVEPDLEKFNEENLKSSTSNQLKCSVCGVHSPTLDEHEVHITQCVAKFAAEINQNQNLVLKLKTTNTPDGLQIFEASPCPTEQKIDIKQEVPYIIENTDGSENHLTCPLCLEVFPFELYKNHLKPATSQIIYKCRDCQFYSKTETDVYDHSKLHDVNNITLGDVGYSIFNIDARYHGLDTKELPGLWNFCGRCEGYFPSIEHFISHLDECEAVEEERISFKNEPVVFSSKLKLGLPKLDCKDFITKIQEFNNCPVCFEVFTPEEYSSHLELKYPSQQFFQCNICKEGFSSKILLICHMRSHGNNKKNYYKFTVETKSHKGNLWLFCNKCPCYTSSILVFLNHLLQCDALADQLKV